jgi:DNA-binding transcriptional LysR family regulator
MLDPRKLRLLVELADRGTISAVAETLDFTPSTVSHSLSTLEREVGVSLLERSPRSVRLTRAGASLAAEARTILARLGAAEADARAVGRLDSGELVMATFPSAGATIVAGAVTLLRKRHPRLELRILDAEPDESIGQVAAGEVDVAVVYEYPYLPTVDLAGFEALHLTDDRLRLRLSHEHPRGGSDRVELRKLKEEAFVAGRRGSACNGFVHAMCARAGFEPRIAFETDDIAFTCALVNAGVAVTVMPDLLVGTAAHSILTRDLSPTLPPRRISAICRASARGLPSIETAMTALADAAAAAGAAAIPAPQEPLVADSPMGRIGPTCVNDAA